MQREDFRLQWDELALTRSELERQTLQFEEQNKTLRVQRFENTFFQMLSQFQDVVNNLSYSYQQGRDMVDVTGREIFFVAFEKVPHFTTVNSQDVVCQGMRGLLATKGLDGYVESNTPTYFDHYFRLLYRTYGISRNRRLSIHMMRNMNMPTSCAPSYRVTNWYGSITTRSQTMAAKR